MTEHPGGFYINRSSDSLVRGFWETVPELLGREVRFRVDIISDVFSTARYRPLLVSAHLCQGCA